MQEVSPGFYWTAEREKNDAMPDDSQRISEIMEIMQSRWDLPPDCNDGELFTYAEALFDRIKNGEDRLALYAYLSDIQTSKLGIPASEAFREIVDRSARLASDKI